VNRDRGTFTRQTVYTRSRASRLLLALTTLLALSAQAAVAQTRTDSPQRQPPQRVSALPDLLIAQSRIGRARQRQGQITIPVTYVMRNAGRGHAGSFRLGVKVGIGETAKRPRTALLVYAKGVADRFTLRSGESREIRADVVIEDPRGTFVGREIRLRSTIDVDARVIESDETNNTSLGPLRLVDSQPRRVSPQDTEPRRVSPPSSDSQPTRVREAPPRESPQRVRGETLSTVGEVTLSPDLPSAGSGYETPHPVIPPGPGTYANFDLSPLYVGDDGGAYYVTRRGQDVVFLGEHPGQADYANVFRGTLQGTRFEGSWWDIPKGGSTGSGTLLISAEQAGRRLSVISQSGGFPVTSWEAVELDSISHPTAREQGFGTTSQEDLDGLWRSQASSLYLRELGADVVGLLESDFAAGGSPMWARVFFGQRSPDGSAVEGHFTDVPKGAGDASIFDRFQVLSANRLQRDGGDQFTRGGGDLLPPQVMTLFNANLMGEEIEQRLADRAVGFGYAIAKRGSVVRTGGGGSRLLAMDGGPLPFDGNTQKGVQSTSKTITAAAAMHVLEAAGLTVDNKMGPYLPSYWVIGSDVSKMTFRHLLDHTSGLRGVGDPDEFESLRQSIANGAARDEDTGASLFGIEEYDNVNFALFRLLIPYIENQDEMDYFESVQGMQGELLNQECSERYVHYVRNHLLLPAGLSNPTTYYSSSNQAYYYNFQRQDVAGHAQTQDQLQESGAGAWVLSSREFAQFLTALEEGQLISPQALAQMKADGLGLRRSNRSSGTYYSHGGSLGGGQHGAYGQGRGARAAIVLMPNQIQAVVQVNSANNPSPAHTAGQLAGLLIEAYELALTTP